MTWDIKDEKLTKTFTFKDFKEAIFFVNKVADIAESLNHHPDIYIYDYNKVLVSVFTHSEGKITNKDYTLTEKIDTLM